MPKGRDENPIYLSGSLRWRLHFQSSAAAICESRFSGPAPALGENSVSKYITSVEQSCPRIPRFLVTTVQLRVVLYRLCLQSTLQHILYRSRITARSWLEWTLYTGNMQLSLL